jgi:hypothetical protein
MVQGHFQNSTIRYDRLLRPIGSSPAAASASAQ